MSRRGSWPLVVVVALIASSGCSGGGPTPIPSPVQSSPSPTGSPPASAGPSPTPNEGFAFTVGDVLAYYQSLGYGCADPGPSTIAAGYTVVTCQLVDPAGRTRIVGLVTDATGTLGNGFAGVWARDGEAYLDPAAALDPLAAFLGTMMGADRGAEAAIWMKQHLGAAYVRTTIGRLAVATYTGSDDDPSELYVEVADEAYLTASPVPRD